MNDIIYKYEVVRAWQKCHGIGNFMDAVNQRGSDERVLAIRIFRYLGVRKFIKFWKALLEYEGTVAWRF